MYYTRDRFGVKQGVCGLVRCTQLALSRAEELALVGLDVEPLCALGFAVEKALAPKRVVLLGYNNGSCCYLPTSAEIARGGYEAESYLGKPWTGPLGPGIEDCIIAGLTRLQ